MSNFIIYKNFSKILLTYYFDYDNFKMQERDKGVNKMKNIKLKSIIAISVGVIIIIALILINFNLSIKAVNNCIDNGQDATVCNELWK